ncbi:aminotransferase class V-fold PLP-dependent enzyme [Hymenobacter volaticus]|uniref:Aminotransferase class V-fold PLP-dependent enzyme n=1 Tax=Hymenobacter volaticus TaxID=2932254 RepID=A0ABY4GFW5_9BACT|nr:aminotransferase class V-fold PLP-dependent enzyme [Hymenobacter volaticus]UOQ69716.1 aminotransferase class V-fold PLP-dependent enzyme [Hymenobacter volaticus]
MAQQTIDGMLNYISGGMANLHGTFATSRATDALLEAGRQGIADLLNCQPQEVAFGQNMTSLAFAIARSLATFIHTGDEIVVTELDHRANVDPWVTLAKDCGAVVKFIPVNLETYTLELVQIDELITSNTKLVAVTMSSNVVGTVPPVEQIIARAKAVGAWVVLDAVHATPHYPIDFQKLGADILFCSAYKFFGPHLGIAVVSAGLFDKLPVYKLAPAPTYIPDKLETGTQNHEGIAGLLGALAFIETLGEGTTRPQRLRTAMQAIEVHEQAQAHRLESFLQELPQVRVYRAPADTRKTPTVAFTLENVNSREACAWFAEHYNLAIADGHFYASTLAEKLGIMAQGGWIRLGLAPYNTDQEIELFRTALLDFLKEGA